MLCSLDHCKFLEFLFLVQLCFWFSFLFSKFFI
uniref:Uncharacterized protein n=1 Tax=Anguilla anguilla TaxID=7936 RepID=A0A0E9VP56_ANGAN